MHFYDRIANSKTHGTATNVVVQIRKCKQNVLMNRKIAFLPLAHFEECFCLCNPIFNTSPDQADWWCKQKVVIFFNRASIVRESLSYNLTRRADVIAQSVIEPDRSFIRIIFHSVAGNNLRGRWKTGLKGHVKLKQNKCLPRHNRATISFLDLCVCAFSCGGNLYVFVYWFLLKIWAHPILVCCCVMFVSHLMLVCVCL